MTASTASRNHGSAKFSPALPIAVALGFVLAISAQERPHDDHAHDGIHPVSGRELAPVMGVGGALWLERPGRVEEEKPEVVIAAMELKPDDIVADLGCGTGFFTRRIAPEIPQGRLYAVDIQPGMLELLKENVDKEGLDNVIPVLGKVDDPLLPRGGIDWMILVDVYHEFQDPEPMLAKMLEALAPDGKVALVEYRLLGDTAKHIKVEHRMSVRQVLAEWQAAGFELFDLITTLPSQDIFIFRKRPAF
jgi:SAM-dependent methyltransferase